MKNTVMVSVVFAVFAILAQDAAPVSAAPVNQDLTVEVRAKDKLDDAFAEYAKKRGFTYGERSVDGRIYYKGSAPVDQPVESATFIKSRTFAYERAYLSALGQYVMDFFGRELTETCHETFGDQSTNAEEAPVRSAADVLEKVKLLTEAKLDKALAEAGVDPSSYQGKELVEKRRLMQDTLVKRTVNKALHTSSGCLPVKTFEARGTDGRYYIGVVVRIGADCTALARAFRAKQRPALSRDGGMTVKEALPATTEEMVQTFGVRLYFDETGTPSLLSFGQFASSYKGKSAQLADRAEIQAQKQARALADSALTAFINGFSDMTSESEVGEDISSSRLFYSDGTATPEEAADVIDVYRSRIKQTASDTLKGRTTVYERMIKHPSGHRVAMCVRRWSFGQVDAVNAVLGQETAVPAEKKNETKKRHDSGVRASRTYDF